MVCQKWHTIFFFRYFWGLPTSQNSSTFAADFGIMSNYIKLYI